MTIDDLNELVRSGDIDEFIRVCEARQVKRLSAIADDICSRKGVRLVLLAGASSAGKTTTAKRICTQLRVNGFSALQLSTDDYFVGDSRNPRDENGEFDYECVQCVDAERLAKDVNALRAGQAVNLRKFNFQTHEGFDADSKTCLDKDGFLVIEGIHALNPILTTDIPDDCKYHIYISPETQPEIFNETKLSSAHGRLLRRLIRDCQFRKTNPDTTFKLWPKVIEGEKKWIEPFRPKADASFDSGLAYELAVLKPYVGGHLERYCLKHPDNYLASMLNQLLATVEPTDSSKVPGDSILRETIGGSQLEYV